MKNFSVLFGIALGITTSAFALAESQAQSVLPTSDHVNVKESFMILNKKGSVAPFKGPADWFTGNVMIDPIHMQVQEPSRITSALVTFEPGARTNWHTHPLGQLLIVTSGTGWTQCEGEARVEIKAGDSIWCPPGHKHWHGATSSEGMSHIAVQESLDGKNVEWLEPVTDEQYGK
ncbi:cupin domain-containing protein [Cellvibrio sp. NN19]|uniref:(R)-mandelonitrile lyase n=1 Tax=Cellvibrio chitinivorans TaxID=3102792 RepID=UPI002B401AF6|nr:cupin domain-containing protein [Cellvibrio sp. NN19]